MRSRNLVAMEDYAWYWVEEAALTGAIAFGGVWARVDGPDCQGAVVVLAPSFSVKVIGFISLPVPSAEIQPGCGYPGATVHFHREQYRGRLGAGHP